MGKKVVILPNWVGDFLMAFASLDPVMEKENLLLCGKKGFYELIRGKYKEEIWIEKEKGLAGALRTVRRLMKSPATTAVLLPNSFSSALIATLSGMSKVVGIPKDGRFFLLTRKVKVDESLHQAEIYRRILEEAGLSFEGGLTGRIYLSRNDRSWAEERLRELGWEDKRIAVIHPGASKPERCWPAERFGEIARRLEELNYKVAVVGSGKEAELGEKVAKSLSSESFYNLAKESVPLGKLSAFIEKAHIFVGNDSGPIHIAGACGLKVVGIYGPSLPEKTGPVMGEGGVFKGVSLRMDCSPCRERFFKECTPINGKPPCIWEITTEMVWEALKTLL